MTLIGFYLITIAAISKAAMDILAHKYSLSVFSLAGRDMFFDPNISWNNKHTIRYRVFDTKLIRLLKRTVFSWTTDGWHLFQMVFLKSLVIGHVLLTIDSTDPVMTVVSNGIGLVIFGFVFELFYSKILMIND